MFLQSIFPPSLVVGSCFLLFLRGRQKLPEEGNKISALGHRVNYSYDDDGDDNQEEEDDDDGGKFQNEILKESVLWVATYGLHGLSLQSIYPTLDYG